MGFLKRFFKSVLVTAVLIGSMTMASGQTGVAPNIRFLETDQALPDGLWRIRLDGDVFTIDKNTSANNNFSTVTTAISIAANGDVTIPNDFFVTGSATVSVDTIAQGQLIVDTDSVEAFLVRKDGDAGDIFRVDTLTDPPHIYIERQSDGAFDLDIRFRRARASATTVVAGDSIAGIDWFGHDGTSFVEGAGIVAFAEGTIGTTRVPMRLSFFTGTDAAPTVITERMRIASSGSFNVIAPGPHTIGGSPSNEVRLYLTGAFTSGGASSQATHIWVDSTLTGFPGDIGSITAIIYDSILITQTASENIQDMAMVMINEPQINASGLTGEIHNAAALMVNAAPTEASGTGSINAAILIGAGGANIGPSDQLGTYDAIVIDQRDRTTNGFDDSGKIVFTGVSFDGSAHDADWQTFVDVTSNAGASTWTLQERVDGAGFVTELSVTSGGDANITNSLSIAGTPSTTGAIRLPVAAQIKWRNDANNADISVIEYNDEDVIFIGEGTGGGAGVVSVNIEPAVNFGGAAVFDGNAIIDVTNTEAFLVRKDGDGGDIFNVDSSTGAVSFGPIFGADSFFFDAGTILGTGNPGIWMGQSVFNSINYQFKMAGPSILHINANIRTIFARDNSEVMRVELRQVAFREKVIMFGTEDAFQLSVKGANSQTSDLVRFQSFTSDTDLMIFQITGEMILGRGLTTPIDGLILDGADRTGDGTTDSHAFLMTGQSFESATPHDSDWRQFVDVTSNAGASTWTLQTRIDGASFARMMTVEDNGTVTLGVDGTLDSNLVLESSSAGLSMAFRFTGVNAHVGTVSNSNFNIIQNNIVRGIWTTTGLQLSGASSDLRWGSDNSANVGQTQTARRPASVFVGTQVVVNADATSTHTEPTYAETITAIDGSIEVLDKGSLATQSLQDSDFGEFSNWAEVGDFSEGTENYVYLHSGGTGTLTQTNAQMSFAGQNNRWYRFTYTVSSVTAAGALTLEITTAFGDLAVTLDVSTAGTRTITFQSDSAASSADFVFSATSDTVLDTFTLDDPKLEEIVGGDLILAGKLTGGGTRGLSVDGDGAVSFGPIGGDVSWLFDPGIIIGPANPGIWMGQATNTTANHVLKNAGSPGIVHLNATTRVVLTTANDEVFRVQAALAAFRHKVTMAGTQDSVQLAITGASGQTADLVTWDAFGAESLALIQITGEMILGRGLTSPIDALTLDMTDLVGDGQTDSHSIILTGVAFESATPHDADWKTFVDVTANTGASTWTLQSRIDGAGFATLLSVTDGGVVNTTSAFSVGTTPSTTGSIRLPVGATIDYRNDANNADIEVISFNDEDVIFIGEGTGGGSGVVSVNVEPAVNFAGNAEFEGTALIDLTDVEAFLVRQNSDAGDVFAVDTTNTRVLVGTLTAANQTFETLPEAFSVAEGNFEILDTGTVGSETITDGAFPDSTNWAGAGEWSDTIGPATTFTFASTGNGTLTQTAAQRVTGNEGESARWYRITYTLSSVTNGGNMILSITTAFADTSVPLVATGNGTFTAIFQSHATSAGSNDFVLDVTAAEASDTFTMDDLLLVEIQGGDVIMAGELTGGGTAGLKVFGAGNIAFTDEADVTQGTDINQGVTVNGTSGTITTLTATTGIGNSDSFVVTNNRLRGVDDVVNVSIQSYSGTLETNGLPIVLVSTTTATTFTITIMNVDGTNALNGTFLINYAIINTGPN